MFWCYFEKAPDRTDKDIYRPRDSLPRQKWSELEIDKRDQVACLDQAQLRDHLLKALG